MGKTLILPVYSFFFCCCFSWFGGNGRHLGVATENCHRWCHWRLVAFLCLNMFCSPSKSWQRVATSERLNMSDDERQPLLVALTAAFSGLRALAGARWLRGWSKCWLCLFLFPLPLLYSPLPPPFKLYPPTQHVTRGGCTAHVNFKGGWDSVLCCEIKSTKK